MREGPNIAGIAALVGDPARANMLMELLGGKALTATELANVAGVTSQTASSHLGKLEAAHIIRARKQGRHRYCELHGPDIAHLLETLMGIAGRAGHRPVRTGPREPELRTARVCYDHLAGDYGVMLFEALRQRSVLAKDGEAIVPTSEGREYLADFGIDLANLETERRPLCRACLDWSARREHLAGSLGAALLRRFYELKWASRKPGTRIVAFTPAGAKHFAAHFGAPSG
ncbi:MAG: ArsR/SmtB family transcription factor [Devosia sp.]